MSERVAWGLLLLAGVLDIAWAGSMKLNQGFTRPFWSAASILLLGALVVALSQAMKAIPVGTAYAVWTSVGAVGTIILGIVVFGEALTAVRLICLALIVVGVIGLKLQSA